MNKKRSGKHDTTLVFAVAGVLSHFDTNDNTDDGEDDKANEEADPSLLASSAGRNDSLLGVLQSDFEQRRKHKSIVKAPLFHSPSFGVNLDLLSISLDDVEALVLLLDEHAHLKMGSVTN